MQLMASVDFVDALAKNGILIRRLWADFVEKLFLDPEAGR